MVAPLPHPPLHEEKTLEASEVRYGESRGIRLAPPSNEIHRDDKNRAACEVRLSKDLH